MTEAEMVLSKHVTPAQVESLESRLLHYPQVDCPLEHHFAPGVYLRQITMPARTFVIGHEHVTEHLNVVLSGRASVMMNGQLHHIIGPCVFKSGAGVRKVLYIHEEMKWQTIHVTNETDLVKLEAELIIKSPSFTEYHADMKRLKEHIGGTK